MFSSTFNPRFRTLFMIIAGSIFIVYASCSELEKKTSHATQKKTFVGSTACLDCHQKEYEEWTGSHHEWAMKEVGESTVLGDFNNAIFNGDGLSYTFTKRDEKYCVLIQSKDDILREYEIKYTFGYHPLQQYIVEFPEGKHQVLRVSWDCENKKWFHQYPGEEISEGDWLHWTNGGQRWNTMCAECHSTNLKKKYDPKNHVFNTTFDEINVGCEACHGPLQTHVEKGYVEKKEATSKVSEINMCGPCHARRTKLSRNMKVGEDFHDQYLIQDLNNSYYHVDGQIKEEDFVLGSFMQSKMFHNDVKCTDCHNPHTLELKFEGNALCTQCHEKKYDSQAHHFHPTTGKESQCISCHMTGKTYMGNDFRRDHSFRIPRPDQSIQFNTPNACMDCHKEKGNEWAAKRIVEWYGPDRKESPSDYLLLARSEAMSEKEYMKLLDFVQSETQPAITRTSILNSLPYRFDEHEVETLLKCLESTSPLVRYTALVQFENLPQKEREVVAKRHLKDDRKLVRIGASRLMVETEIDDLSMEDQALLKKGRKELQEMLMANADFPLGRLQLGDYYLRRKQVDLAIQEYEMALEMDHKLSVVHSNLASAYNLIGKNQEALETLNRLIDLEPEYDRGYYLRGLLSYEMGNKNQAVADLKKALELNPGNPSYLRNLNQIEP